MDKQLVDDEIGLQKEKLKEILKSDIDYPDRGEKISKIIETLSALKKFREEYEFD